MNQTPQVQILDKATKQQNKTNPVLQVDGPSK